MGKGKRKRTKGNTSSSDNSKSNQNTSATSVSKEKPDVKNNVSGLNLNRKKIDIVPSPTTDKKNEPRNKSDAEQRSENAHSMEGELKEIYAAEVRSSDCKEHNKADQRDLNCDNRNSDFGGNSKSEDHQVSHEVDWREEKQSSSAKDGSRRHSGFSKSPCDRSNNKPKSYGEQKVNQFHQDLSNEGRNREYQKKHTSKECQKSLDEYCENEGNQRYLTKDNKKQQYSQSREKANNRHSERDEADEYNRNKFRNRSKNRSKAEGFDEFEAFYKKEKNLQYHVVHEVDGDLFTASTEYSLGHCVAEDMKMGSGIAVSFRRDFKSVDELLGQRKNQGNVAILENKGRYIYYLVTKRESTGKPTYQTLWSSLHKMKDHIIANNVKKIALPRIGCGLDNLEWHTVKAMLEYTFKDVDIEIKIYNFQQDPDAPSSSSKPRKCWVVNDPKPLTEIEPNTIMVYFLSEDGYETDEIKSLYNKFPFLRFSVRDGSSKTLGTFVNTQRNNYNFYGCVVRKSHKDLFNFQAFQKCLNNIQSRNRKEQYGYIAFQAFLEDGSELIVEKIVNLISHSMTFVEVYVCWPEHLLQFMPGRQQFPDKSTTNQHPKFNNP